MNEQTNSPGSPEHLEFQMAVLSLSWSRIGRLDDSSLHLMLAVTERLQREHNRTPPPGWILDVTNLLCGEPRLWPGKEGPFPDSLLCAYEDDVVFRMLNSLELERINAWLRTHPREPRAAVVTYTIQRILARLNWQPAPCSFATLRRLREIGPEGIRAQLQALTDQPAPLEIQQQLQELTTGFRRSAILLTKTDVVTVQSGAAGLAPPARIAVRQAADCCHMLQATDRRLRRQIRPDSIQPPSKRESATATFPTGGYSSIGRKGRLESLVHTELAFLEPDGSRPDLFDLKLSRDELMYFQRDESLQSEVNPAFELQLGSSLQHLRVPHPEFRCQIIIVLVAWVRNLMQDLLPPGTPAIARILTFNEPLPSTNPGDDNLQPASFSANEPLQDELELLSHLLRDSIRSHALILGNRESPQAHGDAKKVWLTGVDPNFTTASPGCRPGLNVSISASTLQLSLLKQVSGPSSSAHQLFVGANDSHGWGRLRGCVKEWLVSADG